MRKLICLLIVVVLLLGCTGCGSQETPETTAPTETTAPVNAVDYTPYMCPWTAEDLEKARSDGKMHYFFMAGEGIHISRSQENVDKWGDSTLVVFPNGKLMLIDTGPVNYGPVLLRNLQQMGVERLDYMLITHPHGDHQNGAFSEENRDGGILDLIGVDQVYWRGGGVGSSEKDMMVAKVCTEKNIPFEVVEQGTVLEFGQVKMTFLWPAVGTSNTFVPKADINDKSIVHRFDFQEHSALFAADLYVAGENALMAVTDPALLDTDFLKVPHHGHATSSSMDFIKAISPELSVAMARVPIQSTLREMYKQIGSTLLYDLVNGYIHVSAAADGTMEYTTTRNHDPARQGELNIPSASLPPLPLS